MKSRFMKRMLSFILATVLLMGNVMPVMAEGSVSGNEVAETVVEETVVEESAVSEEPVSESEINIEEESSEVSTTETTEETTTVESTTEESSEEATTEVSTEETTEETTEESVSENEIPEDELSVSANEIIDEDVPLAGALPVSLEPVTVNGITITVSGPASAFAEGTTVSAVEVEPAEVVIEAAEESEQAEVKRYKAFDINLVCNGEVVQPLNGEEITVNFEGDLLIPNTDEEEDVVVYHVDDNDEITKMEAEVATVETEDATEVETVEMTTTHFSTYVVVITGAESEYKVTYRHYADVNGDGTEEQFYKPTTEIVKSNTVKTYTDFETAGKTVGVGEYEISSIVIDYQNPSKQDVKIDLASYWPREVEVEIEDNATINFHYKSIEKMATDSYENEVVFYDYSVGTLKESTITVSVGDRINIWGTEDFTVSMIERDFILLTHVSGNWTKTLTRGEHAYESLIHNGGKTYAQYEYSGRYNRWGNTYGQIKVYSDGGINDIGIQLENGTVVTADELHGRYLAMGKTDIRNKYGSVNISGTNGGNANGFEGGKGTKAIVQGIVSGLSADLKAVNWGTNSAGQKIVEPGYFTSTEVDGAKAVYDTEFKLKFEQSGHNYQLYSAYSDVYGSETLARVTANQEEYDSHIYKKGDISGQFFPLENVPSAQHTEEYFGKTYNWYYGMRYDFSFELGDYIGPLEYAFEGDDDLWVFVDGELVLDLGGVHSAYPSRYSGTISNKVDIWEKYFGVSKAERNANPNDWWEKIEQLGNGKYDPEKTYTVTVLYMERGGYASTCFMDFTLPNVESRHVNQSYGSLSFTKTAGDKNNMPLAGAEFALYDSAGNFIKSDTSNENGVVKFDGLVAGDYTIQETRSPEGYLLSNEVWTVTATERTNNDTVTVDVVLKDSNGNVVTTIVNEPEIRDIDLEFIKVDSQTDSALSGAEFTLTSEDGEFTKTATSDTNGKIVFEKISEGIYILKEKTAPEGYLPSEETLTVKVEMINGELGYTVSGDEDNDWLFYDTDDDGKHLLKNVKPINIEIIKEWKDYEGRILQDNKIKTESITVKLFREVEGQNGSKEEVVFPNGPIVLRKSDNQEENWRVVIEDLPSACEVGQWIYSVEEVTEVEGFESKCDIAPITNDNVITLTIINTELVGNLKITKTVFREDGDNPVDAVHGDAVFIFKITCHNDLNKEDDDTILYRTISYTESETESEAGRTKSVTVENLPVGSYTVEELYSLRYECTSNRVQTDSVEADYTPNYSFSNKKVYDGNYSHTDVAVNKVTFERDAEGNIIKAKYDQVKTSATEPVTEYKKGE